MKILGHTYAPKKGTVVDGLPAVIVLESGTTTKFITDSQIGDADYPWLTIVSMPTKEFETKFARTQDDLQAIAKIYREHAQQLGATPEALDALGYIFTIDEGTVNMATATATATATEEKKAKPVATSKAPTKTTAPKPAAKATTPPPAKEAKPKAAAPKEPEEKRPSVSSRICELIMAGKLSDDDIFATVKKEFNLDDSKRGYVGWNRNHLKKQGQNPPGPIGGAEKKADKPAAAPKAAASKAPPAKAPVSRKTGSGKG